MITGGISGWEQCTIYRCIVHAATVSQKKTFVLMRPAGNGVGMVIMRMDEVFTVNWSVLCGCKNIWSELSKTCIQNMEWSMQFTVQERSWPQSGSQRCIRVYHRWQCYCESMIIGARQISRRWLDGRRDSGRVFGNAGYRIEDRYGQSAYIL